MTDNILFSTDPGGDLKKFLREKNYSKIAVLTDEHTAQYCYPVIRDFLPAHKRIEIPSGEEYKNISTCEKIWEQMTLEEMDRHSALIIIGGGVLGDMGGFCAATFKRGIDFVLIPTTLLSQVDASIGGKLGVDFMHFKNHIGVFQTPVFTLLHSGFLKTLPEAEKRSGFAEVIKHALISDAATWKEIQKHTLVDQPWQMLLQHSVKAKLKVVTSDPYEKGLRKTLNAGHTIGHAVETFLLQSNRKILHGEAVAVGLVCEAYLSREKGMLTPPEFEDIRKYILEVFGKVDLAPEDEEAIAKLTSQDKKNRKSKILCVLLNGVGDAKWDCEIRQDEVKRALAFYRSA
ncbi:MAG TPA: 3-dehydroquinate synthase [Chryseosolibacter sp.]|nr:3-dehydroquinate synthase [Chryseosolibacter sp.]